MTDEKYINFKSNYEQLMGQMVLCHTKEIEIVKSCNQLRQTINDNSIKIKQIMQMAQTESRVIQELQNELTNAKSVLMVQKEKDEKSKIKIENLTKMWRNLETIIKNSDNFNQEKIEEYNRLLKLKEDLTQINQTKESDIAQLEEELLILR